MSQPSKNFYSVNVEYTGSGHVPWFGSLDPMLLAEWFNLRKEGYPIQFITGTLTKNNGKYTVVQNQK